MLESAWNSLQDGLKRAKNLDDVIKIHDAYLQDILERALLVPHHDNLNNQVRIFHMNALCSTITLLHNSNTYYVIRITFLFYFE